MWLGAAAAAPLTLAQTSVGNTATVTLPAAMTCASPGGGVCAWDATVTTQVTAPVLTVTKTASPASFTVGAPASYTLRVTNSGTAATTAAATVTDAVPAGLALGAMPAGCSATGQTVTCTVAAGLAAGGSQVSFVVPVTPTATAGTSVNGALGGTAVANVLGNDLLNATPATLSTVTLSQVSTSQPGITLDVTTRAVNVAAGTPAGTYALVYRICEQLNPSNCDNATVTVTVTTSASIDALDDNYASTPISGTAGGSTAGSVIANDTSNGATVVLGSNASLNPRAVTTPPANGSVSMNAGGNIVVAAGTTAGSHHTPHVRQRHRHRGRQRRGHRRRRRRRLRLSAAEVGTSATIVCTFTNERLPVVRLAKTLPDGRSAAGDQFTLRIASGGSVLANATTTGATVTPAQAAVLDPATAGTVYTLSELAAGTTNLAQYISGWSCSNTRAGGQTPSGSGASFDITPVAGDDLSCTLRNARAADLSITKSNNQTGYLRGQQVTYQIVASNAGPSPANGAVVTDTFPTSLDTVTWTCGAGTGGGSCATASGSGNINHGVNLPVGASVTFTATGTVSASASGNLVNGASIALAGVTDPTPGNNSATDTDTPAVRLTLAKTWVGATPNDAVNVSVSGTPAPIGTGALASVANTASETDTASASYGVQPGQTYTVTEAFTTGAAGSYSKSLSCTGNTGSGAALGYTANALSGTLTVGATASDIVCTFTNARVPVIRLQKTLPNGRVAAGDQFTLAMTGTGAPAAMTTTGSGTTATGVLTHSTATAGSAYTLSEAGAGGALLANYVTTYSCTNALSGGQTPSGTGTSFSITPVAGDDLTCTFSNARLVGQITLAKTASPSPVVTGAVVTYTLTVGNPAGGPAVANAVLRDAPGAGLDCTQAGLAAPICTPLSGGAQCPASVTAAALLSGGGVTLPSLPANSSLAVTLQCRVTASGQ
ncbi:DUF11 domain-containing protein [Pseudorhodoferax sp. Leaf267]|uniref:DUF11 domain-containing protein n=1 Tax=Pseudorhodoferax sp. Leaf267 TaxID=1736316 RepID=UPI0006F7B85D|nr:DUF11 domain-containing protein [Pseudorhodoferax sp. Leaf267]KQP12565.1 hypothetical protein ASF43_20150 [Pseudorhodoferax sp. Leaf267]